MFQNCPECQCDQSHMLWAGRGKSLEAHLTHGKSSPASSRQLSLTRPQGRMACKSVSLGTSLVRGEQGALFTPKYQGFSFLPYSTRRLTNHSHFLSVDPVSCEVAFLAMVGMEWTGNVCWGRRTA